MLFVLLNLHPLCFLDMLLIHVKGCVQVHGGVTSSENGEQCSLLHWVGVTSIDQLQCQLKTAMPLVPTQLQPMFTWRYCPIVSCQAMTRPKVGNLTFKWQHISILYFSCCAIISAIAVPLYQLLPQSDWADTRMEFLLSLPCFCQWRRRRELVQPSSCPLLSPLPGYVVDARWQLTHSGTWTI